MSITVCLSTPSGIVRKKPNHKLRGGQYASYRLHALSSFQDRNARCSARNILQQSLRHAFRDFFPLKCLLSSFFCLWYTAKKQNKKLFPSLCWVEAKQVSKRPFNCSQVVVMQQNRALRVDKVFYDISKLSCLFYVGVMHTPDCLLHFTEVSMIH